MRGFLERLAGITPAKGRRIIALADVMEGQAAWRAAQKAAGWRVRRMITRAVMKGEALTDRKSVV